MQDKWMEAVSENDGNLAYRVQEGNAHDGDAALQYIYNGLIWLWADPSVSGSLTGKVDVGGW